MEELTDLEICRKIADIEDVHYMETKYKGNANFIALVSENDFTGTPPEMIGKYDPLNDNALCFMLQNEYEVCVHYGSGDVFICGGDSHDGCLAVESFDIDDKKTLNKAICLVIIKAIK